MFPVLLKIKISSLIAGNSGQILIISYLHGWKLSLDSSGADIGSNTSLDKHWKCIGALDPISHQCSSVSVYRKCIGSDNKRVPNKRIGYYWGIGCNFLCILTIFYLLFLYI